MRKFNYERVVFYGRHDYAASMFRDRCLTVLGDTENVSVSSINDAIEAHQIKQTVEGVPELFRDQSVSDSSRHAKALFSRACKFVASELESESINELYDQTELQYGEEFWQLIEACGAWKQIKAFDFERLLANHPECIGSILQYEKARDYFANEIKQALVNNPVFSAEIIIGQLAAESTKQIPIYLPKNMGSSKIDTVMLAYIDSETANPNYLAALSNWPTGKSSLYNPSPEVRIKAKRQYDTSSNDLFLNGAKIKYSIHVTIDMNQIPCKRIARDGFTLTHSFSGRWLKEHTDFATIMNNLIYVFDFVDRNGLMIAPSRRHEDRGIIATLGLRVKGEYRKSIEFQMRSGLTYVETRAYADFLDANGIRLEAALEWVYNQYFANEFNIAGFSLALPSKEASWLDKCKAIGPEIERAIKAYSIYTKHNEIDDDFFPYESLRSFSAFAALKEKKYAVAGPAFERYCNILFSDQCALSHLHERGVSESCFFEMIRKHPVTRDSYPKYLQTSIGELIDDELIIERAKDERLLPTAYAIYLKSIWDHDALPLHRLGETDLQLIQALADRKILDYCNQLFAPCEAAYLDYMFNDASFSNSIGLRNRYDHAHSSIKNPQADSIKDDYHKLLSLLICITLKINEELMRKTGQGGLDALIDWPYYDESMY